MRIKQNSSQKGATFIEILIVIGVISLLSAFGSINLLNARSSSSVSSTLYTFISDLKNQQIKAMAGDTEGRGIPDTYSIYIESSQYTLFHGQNYSSSDTSNFSVSIPTEFTMSTTSVGNKIIFASGSGEIADFSQGTNTVTFTDVSTNQQKSIQFNKHGVVTAIN